MKLPDLRAECCELNCELGRSGLVDITFGNLSVIDRAAGIFAIKPSGVSYDALKPEDIVLVDLDGDIVDSSLRPSSDTPTHRCLFQHFPEAAAVVHTHSRTAVAFAQAGREIPLLGTTHADYFRGPVPVTRAMTPEEISADYEWQTANQSARCSCGAGAESWSFCLGRVRQLCVGDGACFGDYRADGCSGAGAES